MHAVDERDTCALQGFGGGDVRQDHELFDQAMGFEALRRDHAVDGAIGFEKDLAFGEIEVEWLPFGTCTRHCFVSGIEGAENRFNKRLRVLISAPADRQSVPAGRKDARPNAS